MTGKKTAVYRLLAGIGITAVAFGTADGLSSSLLHADTAATTVSTAADIGVAILYMAGVIGILFVLSSVSTLSLIASKEARKESGARH